MKQTLQYQVIPFTHTGNVRQRNEDTYAIEKTKNGDLFVVCDGMGGAAEGKKASEIAVNSIVEYFNIKPYENLQIALLKSIEFANEQIYATALSRVEYNGMGTTACIVLLNNNLAHIAHVGDSRILVQSQSKLHQVTKDHSYVNQLVDAQIITAEVAKNHPEKNRIVKALGVSPTVEPTITKNPLQLAKDDELLICSDGLTDMVTDNKIELTLNQKTSLVDKGSSLLNSALQNGGNDNITFILVEITQSPFKKSVFQPILVNQSVKKSKRKILKLFLLFLILSILGVGIYFGNDYWKKSKKAETIEKKSTSNTKETHPSVKIDSVFETEKAEKIFNK